MPIGGSLLAAERALSVSAGGLFCYYPDMPSNNQQRARIRRATRTEGTESHQDALGYINAALVHIVEALTEKAKAGDTQAASQLFKLSQEEFSRARSGANDPLLIRIKEIRAAGSGMEQELWGKLYRNVDKPLMEMKSSL